MSVMLTMVICLGMMPIYNKELRTDCFQIDSRGERMERKILNESRSIKIFCGFLLISCVSINLIFLPFIGDEDKFLCQFKVLYHTFGTYFGITFLMITLAVEGWILSICVCIPAHIVFHMRFQFLLLNDYVKVLDISENAVVMHDKNYQEFVHHKLKQCVEHHIEIMR
ncbi:hypothetical protein JTB14_032740 [Gonioctena quinquepunctata]|nr:hypothetical protein JTB14_032740 [Gonioctena quinquepunctata]